VKTRVSKRLQWAGIDDYLASLPAAQRQALEKLRAAISRAAPAADEGFSYGLPAFRLNGRPLVCFGAASTHCSLYPLSPAAIRKPPAAPPRSNTSQGTIQFVAPLPAGLVRKIVKARIAELQA